MAVQCGATGKPTLAQVERGIAAARPDDPSSNSGRANQL